MTGLDEEIVTHRRTTRNVEIRISILPNASDDGFAVRVGRIESSDGYGVSVHLTAEDCRAIAATLEEAERLYARPRRTSAR